MHSYEISCVCCGVVEAFPFMGCWVVWVDIWLLTFQDSTSVASLRVKQFEIQMLSQTSQKSEGLMPSFYQSDC